MSLLEKLKKNSTIKDTAILSKSKFFAAKDMIQTSIPVVNVAFSGDLDGGFTPGLTMWAGPSKHFKTAFSLLMAKASGASTKALRALALKHAEEEVALNKASLATAKNTYEKNKNTLASLINSGASDELIEKQREITIESRKASAEERKDLEEALKNKKYIIRKNAVEVQQEITDKNTKLKESNKTHNDAIKQQNEEAAKVELDRIKTLKESILALDEEIRVSKLTDEEKEVDAINKKYTRLIEEGKKAKIDVSTLEEEKRLSLAAITKKYDDADASIRLTNSQNVISEMVAAGTKRLEGEKATSEKSIEIAKEEKEKKAALLQQQLDLVKGSFQAFADVATLFAGKNKKAQKTAFNIQKAANIASATIDTYTAATAAFKSAVGIPVVGPVLAPIAAAGAVAAGLMNIKKIEKFRDKLGKFRQSGLQLGGEFSTENLAFKLLRRAGYMDKLAKLQSAVVDKQLSVTEVK